METSALDAGDFVKIVRAHGSVNVSRVLKTILCLNIVVGNEFVSINAAGIIAPIAIAPMLTATFWRCS